MIVDNVGTMWYTIDSQGCANIRLAHNTKDGTMPDSNGVYSVGDVAYIFDTKVGTVRNWMSTGKLSKTPTKLDVANFAASRATSGRGKGTKTYHVTDLTPEQFEILQVLCVENGMSAVDPTIVQQEKSAALKAAAGRNLANQGVDIASLRADIGVNMD